MSAHAAADPIQRIVGRLPRIRPPFGALLEGGALGGLVGVSAAIVVAAAERRSALSPPSHAGFPRWYAGPLEGLVPSLTRATTTLSSDLAWGIVAMTACWLVVVARGRRLHAAPVVAAIVVLHAVFLLSPPLSLTDLFNYLGYARLHAVYGLNPYTTPPIAAPHDAWYHFSNWHRLRSPYGPLFTLATLPLGRLPVPTAYWVYKGAVTAASLGSLALLWDIARRLGRRPAQVVAFVGLCPVVLVYGLGGQHNDVFVALLLLAGVALALRGHGVLAGVALAGAVGLKTSALLGAVPLLVALPRRGRVVLGAALGGAAVVLASVSAFGAHLPDLAQQSRMVAPFSVPNLAGLAAGIGGADAHVRALGQDILAAGVAAAALLAALRRDRAPEAAAWLALLALVTLSWAMPWYALWVLPFAALAATRAVKVAAAAIVVYLVLAWSPITLDAVHDVHAYPTQTAVGRANHRYIVSLLLDHPTQRHRRHRRHRRHAVTARHRRPARPARAQVP